MHSLIYKQSIYPLHIQQGSQVMARAGRVSLPSLLRPHPCPSPAVFADAFPYVAFHSWHATESFLQHRSAGVAILRLRINSAAVQPGSCSGLCRSISASTTVPTFQDLPSPFRYFNRSTFCSENGLIHGDVEKISRK